jgi:hypothetical protein
MSDVKVSKGYNGKQGGTIYKGNTKATIYKVNGRDMLSEELDEYIMSIVGDQTINAKELDKTLKIGVKKVSTALARLYHDGLLQNNIFEGCKHYFKTERCLLQDILHPRPKFKELNKATYNEKWFIKRLKLEGVPKKPRRKRGEKDIYKKYGD